MNALLLSSIIFLSVLFPREIFERDDFSFFITRSCRKRFASFEQDEKVPPPVGRGATYKGLKLNDEPRTEYHRKGEVLYVIGRIKPSLLGELKKHKTSVVVLRSRGGSVRAARRASRYLRQNNIAAYVPPGALCASACAQVFSGAVARYMGERSTLVFHQARWRSKCHLQYVVWKEAQGNPHKMNKIVRKLKRFVARQETLMERTLLKNLGFDFIDHYMSSLKFNPTISATSSNILRHGDVFVTTAEALKLGVIRDVEGLIDEHLSFVEGHQVDLDLTFLREPRFADYEGDLFF